MLIFNCMSLVQTSSKVRKGVVITVAVISLYIIFLMVKSPIRQMWYAFFPPADLPTVAFGYLDPLEFTEAPIVSSVPEYVLNTPTGRLPTDLKTSLAVYKYVSPSFSFSEGKRAQQDAATLGFSDTMRVSDLSSDLFTWQDVQFGGNLKIDTKTRTLELETPLANLGSLFPVEKYTQTNAVAAARSLLQKVNRFNDKLYTSDMRGYQEVRFGKFSGTRVVEVDSIPETQIARVDFFRKILDFPILGPDPKQGLLQVYLRGPETKDAFPQLNFPHVRAYHWEINTGDSATYPLTPIETVWEQISQNNGAIVNVTPQGASPFETPLATRVDRVLINEVYFAYYDNITPQQFLQPVYVFEGNYTTGAGAFCSITIYYPAVSSEYVRAPVNTQTPASPGQL